MSSGGQLSSLVFLVQHAAVAALARRTPPEQITAADAKKALEALQTLLSPQLSRQAWATLRARHADRQLTNEEAERNLLYNGTLLEYGDGQPWCDVHPALWALMDTVTVDEPS